MILIRNQFLFMHCALLVKKLVVLLKYFADFHIFRLLIINLSLFISTFTFFVLYSYFLSLQLYCHGYSFQVFVMTYYILRFFLFYYEMSSKHEIMQFCFYIEFSDSVFQIIWVLEETNSPVYLVFLRSLKLLIFNLYRLIFFSLLLTATEVYLMHI